MRWGFAAAGAGIVLALIGYARLDPALPFLYAGGRLEWWVHPEPLSLSGDATDHELTFFFTPERAGQLELAVMSRFTLFDGAAVLAEGEWGTWKRSQHVEVPQRPLRLVAADARWLPCVGLAGPAAPHLVRVVGRGEEVRAVPARALFAARPALFGPLRGLAWVLLALLVAGVVGLLARGRSAIAWTPRGPPHGVVVVIVALHIALTLWNVAHYPIERGLDAGGHLAYARLLANDHRVPDPAAGWQTYHPPLYHAVAAIALEATGSERSLQVTSAMAGVGIVLLLAGALGAARWRGLLLVAFLPVLILSEPQATNEVLFAAVATAALVVASAGAPDTRRVALAGLLTGAALLTKYTGVFVLAGVGLMLLREADVAYPRRIRMAATFALVALGIGCWPYLTRWRLYGDPFIGNWDDVLGHPYRQAPGFRLGVYFLRFGTALFSHPFEARASSFWDSLYVSTVADGFGRFILTPTQHAAQLALAWLALPLTVTLLGGFLAMTLGRRRPARAERAGGALTVLLVGALVRFNLEAPYYSVAKGVFALALVYPGALAYERGFALVAARGRLAAWFLDGVLVAFAAVSAAAFTYRGG